MVEYNRDASPREKLSRGWLPIKKCMKYVLIFAGIFYLVGLAFAIQTLVVQTDQSGRCARYGNTLGTSTHPLDTILHQWQDIPLECASVRMISEVVKQPKTPNDEILKQQNRISIPRAAALSITTGGRPGGGPVRMTVHPPSEIVTKGVPCHFVFFLGGGKAGSTTLATWLKQSRESQYNVYTKDSQFLDSSKEVCIARAVQNKQQQDSYTPELLMQFMNPQPANVNACPADRRYALDGCPSLFRKTEFDRLHQMFPDDLPTKYIVLVRDPVDRLVSHYNDNRPPKKIDIDKEILQDKKGLHDGLSKVGALLQSVLSIFPRDRILVVVNEIMKDHPQEVMGDLCDFLELPRRELDLRAPPKNALNHRDVYNWPSEEAVKKTQQRFWPDTKIFLKLLGVSRLPWKIVHAHSNDTVPVKGPPKVKIAAFDAYWDFSKDSELETRNK